MRLDPALSRVPGPITFSTGLGLCSALRRLWAETGFTLDKVARRGGFHSGQQISNLFSGRHDMRVSTALKLATALGYRFQLVPVDRPAVVPQLRTTLCTATVPAGDDISVECQQTLVWSDVLSLQPVSIAHDGGAWHHLDPGHDHHTPEAGQEETRALPIISQLKGNDRG